MKRLLFIAIIAFWGISCQNTQTIEQLFELRASGVVMILNEFYYEVELPDDIKLYYTDISADGDLENYTTDISEIKDSHNFITATGFFINEEGVIMTNRHVVQPQIDTSVVKNAFKKLLEEISEYNRNQYANQYLELEGEKSNYSVHDAYTGNSFYDLDRLQEISDQQSSIIRQYQNDRRLLEDINSPSYLNRMRINTICKIGIAYNDTYVTSLEDFGGANACVVIKVSEQEEVDLATIQLKNKRTPENTYIFDVTGEKTESESIFEKLYSLIKPESKKKELKIGQDLYMIGYNAGVTLGTTKQGIKVQLTTGKLTQQSDGQRLLYSIPAIQGSSGSPVIDAEGNFVGVNFAKFKGADNFNFGIPAMKVLQFYEE